jgi:hypothetical protein
VIDYGFLSMIDFSSIAVFILGTTTINSRFPQVLRTYYESRILPIHETWSRFFPHTHFVFGTNQFDYDFLTQRCTQIYENGESIQSTKRRSLIARTPQVSPENKMDLYHCPVRSEFGEGRWDPISLSPQPELSGGWTQFDYATFNSTASSNTTTLSNPQQVDVVNRAYKHSHQPHASRPIKVLFSHNCTGEYFGIGPTCRCQETMRYFLHHARPLRKFHNVKWFLFLDDDIYLRPFGLMSMLHFLELHSHSIMNVVTNSFVRIGRTSRPIAFVSAGGSHGSLLRAKNRTEAIVSNCQLTFSDGYSFAQPAILNRYVMMFERKSLVVNLRNLRVSL